MLIVRCSTYLFTARTKVIPTKLCRTPASIAMGGAQLSNALRITDVNDFLAPSTACVLPLGGGALPENADQNAVAKLPAEPAGSVLTPIIPTASVGQARAKVTVSDCLACSGCVTSAETVLLSTESVDAFKKCVQDGGRFMVVGLSQQAVASIAVHYGMSLEDTARRLAGFLRTKCNFDAVVDLSFPRYLAHLEAAEEFLERYRAGKKLTVTSACPGWVTYAEKTQGSDILDCISTVRSPQGIFGAIAQRLRPEKDKRPVWVSSIMPCHDKKIEASRPDLTKVENGLNVKELDCVLTTGELMDVMKEMEYDLRRGVEGRFEHLGSDVDKFGVNVASGSGGYAEFILRRTAKVLMGSELPAGRLITKKCSRSGDLKTFTLRDEEGNQELTFATAYGFRCLQSILRKMRRGECKYNYIELMACPGGCNNGGGQIPTPMEDEKDGRSAKQQANEYLQRVDNEFANATTEKQAFVNVNVRNIYNMLGNEGSGEAKKGLRMEIASRKTSNVGSLTW